MIEGSKIALFALPIAEPVLIIALVLLILLVAPVFSERLRIPSIVGLLISGAVIGTHGLNLVSPDLEFSLDLAERHGILAVGDPRTLEES